VGIAVQIPLFFRVPAVSALAARSRLERGAIRADPWVHLLPQAASAAIRGPTGPGATRLDFL
jgi:hypothetical protein